MEIGTEVSFCCPLSGIAFLVDILRKGDVPPEHLVRLYYGATPPKRAFTATKTDRLVFRRISMDESYVILPDTPTGRLQYIEHRKKGV